MARSKRSPSPAPAPPIVPVPVPCGTPDEIQTGISNALDLRAKLKTTIDELTARRAAGEWAFVTALAKEAAIAAVPLNLENTRAFREWKTADDTLAARIKTAEEVLAVVDRHIECLRTTQPAAVYSELESRRDLLAAQLTQHKEELHQLDEQIKLCKSA